MVKLCNALDLKLYQLLRHEHIGNVVAVLSGCCVLGASVLPWLRDPLGQVYSAWQLPIRFGWLYQMKFLNYGWLCLCCALYSFFSVWVVKGSFRDRPGLMSRPGVTFLLSIAPVVLLLLQYLCADVAAITLLADHEQQLLLIQYHFGYQGSIQLIPLNLLSLNASTIWGKLQLFLDCVSYGPLFLLCTATWLVSGYRRPEGPRVCAVRRRYGWKMVPSIFCLIGLAIVLACAPLGMGCEYMAKEMLARGDYSWSLSLLHYARFFNPEFEQVAYYHVELGKAQYFLSPTQLTSDSRIYLASAYRVQGDYLDAYQQLLTVWQEYPTVPWIVDEMSTTLENIVEANRPLRGIAINRPTADNATLPWLHILAKADASNSYALYMLGRIQYDLHNYRACGLYMSSLLNLSVKDAIRSSAYTYIALSDAGLHDYGDERLLLFKAIALDPSYHNTLAREELSGLH